MLEFARTSSRTSKQMLNRSSKNFELVSDKLCKPRSCVCTASSTYQAHLRHEAYLRDSALRARGSRHFTALLVVNAKERSSRNLRVRELLFDVSHCSNIMLPVRKLGSTLLSVVGSSSNVFFPPPVLMLACTDEYEAPK